MEGAGNAQKRHTVLYGKPENKLRRRDPFRQQPRKEFSGLADRTGEGPACREDEGVLCDPEGPPRHLLAAEEGVAAPPSPPEPCGHAHGHGHAQRPACPQEAGLLTSAPPRPGGGPSHGSDIGPRRRV